MVNGTLKNTTINLITVYSLQFTYTTTTIIKQLTKMNRNTHKV